MSLLNETVRITGARDVVTLMMRAPDIPNALSFGAERQLVVDIADIVEPLEGYVLAEATHIEELLGFTRAWSRKAPLIMQCFAGVSRSTAAAYIAACDLDADRNEDEIAQELRLASPTATPNRHLIALADDILGRRGRMVDAVRAIGRGEDAFEARPFSLWLNERQG